MARCFSATSTKLTAAITWFDEVWGIKPSYQSEFMASFHQEGFTFILDQADEDIACTIGFESINCDQDFKTVVDKGAKIIEKPEDKPWGVRAAYIHGPGKLTLEIEEMKT